MQALLKKRRYWLQIGTHNSLLRIFILCLSASLPYIHLATYCHLWNCPLCHDVRICYTTTMNQSVAACISEHNSNVPTVCTVNMQDVLHICLMGIATLLTITVDFEYNIYVLLSVYLLLGNLNTRVLKNFEFKKGSRDRHKK